MMAQQLDCFLLQAVTEKPFTLLNYQYRELEYRNQSFTRFQFHAKLLAFLEIFMVLQSF
jgi:hypothetical protein